MDELRRGTTRTVSLLLNLLAGVLLVVGAAIGWLAPRLPSADLPAGLDVLGRPLASAHLDPTPYLGADITALAVIVAVVIGFNVTILQIAGQAHSLQLVRGILGTLSPFLLCWSATTGVALVYFLVPAVYIGQLWQQLAWFAAVVLLMVAYLYDLPWRLSGSYVAQWALRGLRRRPVAQWEEIEGYSVLQTAIAGATGRGDLGTMRAIALTLGRFLVDTRDREAEAANLYHRGRYRALKMLLSGCAQGAGQAPTAVAYYLGYIQAGTLLQAVADGHPMDDPEHDLFSGLLRALHGAPEHLYPLWTGLRHALCRPAGHSMPYLLDYWHRRGDWTVDDPRRVERIAAALARFHADCRSELREAAAAGTEEQATEMAVYLYRDLAEYLGQTVARDHHRAAQARLSDLPLMLLDAVHADIMRRWPDTGAEAAPRVGVADAYERYRAQLGGAASRVAG